MVSILLTLNAIICVALIILILLQRSDPASGGMFGGAGSGSQTITRNPLARPTAVLAGLFLIFSVAAAVLNKGGAHGADTVMSTTEAPAPAVLPNAALMPTPATPATGTAPVAAPDVITPQTAPSPTE